MGEPVAQALEFRVFSILGQSFLMRCRRLQLQGQMQAFQTAVLLRLSRVDPFRHTPALTSFTASGESPPAATEANGGPLSLRITWGSPYSRNAASNNGHTWPPSISASAWQRNR